MPRVLCRGLVFILIPLALSWQCGCRRSERERDSRARLSRTTIVLDPGHGGRDTGAWRRGGRPEKEIVLDIALKVERLLRKEKVRVVLTRRDDEYIRLWKRAEIANDHRAALFLSIHANSCDRASVDGFEIYYAHNGRETESRGAAEFIRERFANATGAKDRGIRNQRYLVLTHTKCPSLLIEVGYLSNAKERELLSQETYRGKIAEGLANGILAYLRSRG